MSLNKIISPTQCRYVILVIDEMKVQEDLVYDKTGNNLLGFVNLGNVNSEIEMLEGQLRNDILDPPCENIANHMLTLMVRGLFMKMEFPYANFPTRGLKIISLEITMD